MFEFSFRQILLLALGFGLITGSVFLDPLLAGLESLLYPNAVHWQGVRVVPGKTQQIRAAGEETLVVEDERQPMARLTLFVRRDDSATPQKLIRDLCKRDGCSKSAASLASGSGDTAVANYRNKGESMQIVLMRLPGNSIWVEFKGPPEAFEGFNPLVQSVSAQLTRAAAEGRSSNLASGHSLAAVDR